MQAIPQLKPIQGSKRTEKEIIEMNGLPIFKKSFNPGYEKFFNRELQAYEMLDNRVPFIPKLVCKTGSEIMLEYIQYDQISQDKLLAENLLIVGEIMYHLWQLGYAHLDLHPGNFIVDHKLKMYLVDYEFFYIYSAKPASFLGNYDVKGKPGHGSWGIKGKDPVAFLNQAWKKLAGITLNDIALEYHKRYL